MDNNVLFQKLSTLLFQMGWEFDEIVMREDEFV